MMGFGFVWVIFIIIAIAYVLGWRPDSMKRDQLQAKERPPLEILQERYARGEIGQDEYRKMREDLDS
jgi:putative membrane protein